MASLLLNGAENLRLIHKTPPVGLRSARPSSQLRCLPTRGLQFCSRIKKAKALAPRFSFSSARPACQPRFIQHKQEAFWFNKFLSIVYDHVINPGHWTQDMGHEALEPADLNNKNMVVVDVGGGTGFTTLGIVEHVDAKNVPIRDKSMLLAKAKEKEPLKHC